MATLLADSPPAPSDSQAQPSAPDGAPTEPAAPATPAPQAHSCRHCGAGMTAGEDWCLQCGAGAPGSLGAPSWRPAATVFMLVAALVLGAAAAAVAALSKGGAKAPVVTTTVAAAPSTSTPATTTPPTTPGVAGAPATKSSPLGTVRPPKIPLTASTPKASEKSTATVPPAEATTSTPTSPTPTSTTPTSGAGANGEKANEETQQSAILLDTDAATTYNPYEYPASYFSGPSLAIDDDASTAWTAEVNPATAPKMAEGLLIDLKDKQKVAVLELISSTPGMTVQVYGAKGATAPASITDQAWVPLSAPKVVKKKRTRLALRDSKRQFTYITLWISQAPTGAVGTATAPGHVAVNEIELFPPKS